mmetsp:Transcript_52329/g.46992  ORF Transcript_52329/g.46992 Transcript_52329/m.46992 type:complete len:198 (-) Transcript_52329:19-612(-)
MNISSISKSGIKTALLTTNVMVRRIVIPSTLHILHRSQPLLFQNTHSYITINKRFNHHEYHWKPVAPANKYNMMERDGHGLVNYLHTWEALMFTHSDWKWSTMWLWILSVPVGFAMIHSIWNSLYNDPEVRLRPHKKSWHIPENRLNRADKYRMGGFKWYPIRDCNKRFEYLHDIETNGFHEPGQIGYEDIPIPMDT